jgi:hypothetical protein
VERSAVQACAPEHRGGCPDGLVLAVVVLGRRRSDVVRKEPIAWDASDDAHPVEGADADLPFLALLEGEGAGKSVVQVRGGPELDARFRREHLLEQSERVLPDAEAVLCKPVVDRFAEQSFEAQGSTMRPEARDAARWVETQEAPEPQMRQVQARLAALPGQTLPAALRSDVLVAPQRPG